MNMNRNNFIVAVLAILVVGAGCKKQEETPASIEVSTSTVSIPRSGKLADGSEPTIVLTSNTYWRVFIPEGCDWLNTSPKGAAAGNTEVKLEAESNVNGSPREATISFEALDGTKGLLKVSQSGQETAPKVNARISGMQWKDGDELAVFAGETPLLFYYKDGVFTSDCDLPAAERYAALYPYDVDARFDGEKLNCSLVKAQPYVPAATINPSMSYSAVSDNTDFNLSEMYGTLRINETGKATVLVSTFYNDEESYSVCSDKGIELDKTQPKSFDIVIPEGQYSDVEIGITDLSGEETYYEFPNISINRAQITSVDIYHESSSAFIDLNMPSFYGETGSDKVYSNCFMLTESGDYKFAIADALGNAIDCADIKWVWATTGEWNSLTECVLDELITDMKKKKNSVTFSIPEDFTPGNVILAAVDANGVIKCSWHIWTTVDYKDVEVGGQKWMDRNIGASYFFDPAVPEHCNASRGFMFCWGCKNPIIGYYEGDATVVKGDSFTMGKGATYYIYNPEVKNTGNWSRMETYPAGWKGTLEQYIQYPMTNPDDTDKAPTLNSTANWPAEANPCPYGYELPSIAQMSALASGASDVTVVHDAVNAKKNVACIAGGVSFPSCGYRARLTSVITYANNPDGRYWLNSAVKGNTRSNLIINASNFNTGSSSGLGANMSVRCVKKTK